MEGIIPPVASATHDPLRLPELPHTTEEDTAVRTLTPPPSRDLELVIDKCCVNIRFLLPSLKLKNALSDAN